MEKTTVRLPWAILASVGGAREREDEVRELGEGPGESEGNVRLTDRVLGRHVGVV